MIKIEFPRYGRAKQFQPRNMMFLTQSLDCIELLTNDDGGNRHENVTEIELDGYRNYTTSVASMPLEISPRLKEFIQRLVQFAAEGLSGRALQELLRQARNRPRVDLWPRERAGNGHLQRLAFKAGQ